MRYGWSTFLTFTLSFIFSTHGYDVTVVTETKGQIFTEGLFWDYVNQVLLFVDTIRLEIHRLNISSGQDRFITLKRRPTAIIPTIDSKYGFVVNKDNDVIYLFWPYDIDGGYYAECLIASVDFYCPGNTLNDARADAYGRVWSATFPKRNTNGTYALSQAALYRFNTRRPGKADVTAALTPITYGNDLTWNQANNMFYFTETYLGCIYTFKYDLLNGVICCGQPVFCLSDYNITGELSGLTIDQDKNLWIAVNGAGLILNVNPSTSNLIKTVIIPAKAVTDLEFGGPKLDILYVATRNLRNTSEPLAGSIFQVTGLKVFGIRENYAVMNSDCTPEFF